MGRQPLGRSDPGFAVPQPDADECGADFRRANLTHATFEGALLQNTNFKNALNATAQKLRRAKRIDMATMSDGTVVNNWEEFEVWAQKFT